jgi:hypothetical protein
VAAAPAIDGFQAHFLLPFAFAFCLLPFAFCLCLLPSAFAFCLLPSAFRRVHPVLKAPQIDEVAGDKDLAISGQKAALWA